MPLQNLSAITNTIVYTRLGIVQQQLLEAKSTKSSAIAVGSRDALYQLKFCQLLHKYRNKVIQQIHSNRNN